MYIYIRSQNELTANNIEVYIYNIKNCKLKKACRVLSLIGFIEARRIKTNTRNDYPWPLARAAPTHLLMSDVFLIAPPHDGGGAIRDTSPSQRDVIATFPPSPVTRNLLEES